MRNAIVVFVGALSLLACSKDKPAEDTTTTRGANDMAAPVSVEEIRSALIEKRPSASETINSLVITNDSGIVTLRGKVEDESTHADLVNRVRAMSNVRGVRDELMVHPKSSAVQPQGNDMNSGTTTTTGANQGTQSGSGMGGPTMGTTDQSGSTAGSMNTTSSSRVDAVRDSMTKARPASTATIQALTITANDDGSVVIVTGSVPDEATRQALFKAAKGTDGVKTVKDQMKVMKKPTTTAPKP